MAQYLPVLALLILAALFAALSLVASKLLAPRNPTVEKLAPYECGIIPGREPPERFPVRFYLVALLFVIFDIEIVFIYPWAIASDRFGLFGFLAILTFSALLFESFVYLISKGALDWGPLQVNRSQVDRDLMRSADRTSDSTIRRVGLEGRYDMAVSATALRSGPPNRESPPRSDLDSSAREGQDTLEEVGS